jgi:hypothetical protein
LILSTNTLNPKMSDNRTYSWRVGLLILPTGICQPE